MVSGYEKSPDYGNPPPPGLRGWLIAIAFFAMVAWVIGTSPSNLLDLMTVAR
jgi:hypothetical protein